MGARHRRGGPREEQSRRRRWVQAIHHPWVRLQPSSELTGIKPCDMVDDGRIHAQPGHVHRQGHLAQVQAPPAMDGQGVRLPSTGSWFSARMTRSGPETSITPSSRRCPQGSGRHLRSSFLPGQCFLVSSISLPAFASYASASHSIFWPISLSRPVPLSCFSPLPFFVLFPSPHTLSHQGGS